MNLKTCKTCNHQIHGKYCEQCGEKVVDEQDFTINRILEQAIGEITSFDSKFFKTLKLLFLFPGKLTTFYIEGKRVPYMKPFQIFVISNLVFFLFLSDVDIFRTPSKWFFIEDFDGIKVLDKVRLVAKNEGLSIDEVALKYDQISSNLSKGLIVIMLPLLAVIGKLIHPSNKIEFGKHLVFATHYFSVLLLICVVIGKTLLISNIQVNRWFFIIPISLYLITYYIVAIKNFYNITWFQSLLKGIIGILLINVIIQLYRVTINLITLNYL